MFSEFLANLGYLVALSIVKPLIILSKSAKNLLSGALSSAGLGGNCEKNTQISFQKDIRRKISDKSDHIFKKIGLIRQDYVEISGATHRKLIN